MPTPTTPEPLLKRPTQAADFWHLRFLAEPACSPDGRRVAFALAHADEEHNTYKAHIWVVAADGSGRARQFTHSGKRDGHPVWSPDGAWLAFTSNRSGHKEIWLMPSTGGEARRLTFTRHGAGNPSWAPDSRALAITVELGADDPAPRARAAETDEEDKARKEKAEKAKREAPLRITRLQYKDDSTGLWEGRRTHLWVQALDDEGASDGDPRQISEGDYDDSPAAWSPDGRYLAFSSNRTADADRNLVSDIFVVPAAGGALQQITASKGPADSPAWRPDGGAIAYIGHERKGEAGGGTNDVLFVVPFVSGKDTAAERRDLSAARDRPVGNMSLSDSRLGGVVVYPVWTPDGGALYMTLSDWGRVGLWRFPADGTMPPTQVVGGDRALTEFAFAADRQTVVFGAGDSQNPGDLFAAHVDPAGAAHDERPLTHVNAKHFAGLALSPAEEIHFESADGVPLQGWIIKPPGFDPARQYPALLHIHGGPHLMYGFPFFLEFQLLAAQGYVVFYMNPRGGQGYGQAFADAICRCWGGPDYADLMRGVDVLLESGYVDKTRLGVLGGSYGGYMTCWIVGHTDRFRAGVASRSVTNLISMYGSSDAGWALEDWEFCQLFAGSDSYRELWERSPLAYAPRVTTPLLLTHGADDLRCPIGQAEEMYIALKHLGKVVELVRFPGASHEIARAGAPRMRIGRLDAIVEWFGRYLGETSTEYRVPSTE